MSEQPGHRMIWHDK